MGFLAVEGEEALLWIWYRSVLSSFRC